MSQVSPPVRILLAGCLVFAALWFTMLRPKGDEVAPAPAAPVAPAAGTAPAAPAAGTAPAAAAPQSAPGTAVQTARQGAAQAEAAAASRAGETAPAQPGAPLTSTPTGKAAAGGKSVAVKGVVTKGLPRPIARAVAKNKVIVLLFWNPGAADDRAVRREIRAVRGRRGKVVVHAANIRRVAPYAPITRGVNLDQSPTVVVVDKNLQAEALVGYHDRGAIRQAVSDALRVK